MRPGHMPRGAYAILRGAMARQPHERRRGCAASQPKHANHTQIVQIHSDGPSHGH
jgi:hypothetical protein